MIAAPRALQLLLHARALSSLPPCHQFPRGPCLSASHRLLQLLLEALRSRTASASAANAIRRLCDACGSQMRGCVDVLMQLYAQVG